MLSRKEKQNLLHLAAVLSSKKHQQLAQEFAVSLSKDTARLLRLVAYPKSFLSLIMPSTVGVIEDQVTIDPQPSPTPDPFFAFDREKEKEKEGPILAWLDTATSSVTGTKKRPNTLYPNVLSLNPLREEDFECVYALEIGDQFILTSNMRRQYGKNWPRHIENATLLTYEQYVKKSAQRGC